MRRYFTLFFVCLLGSTVLFAEEAAIVNFTDLATNGAATEIDYSIAAGDSFTEAERAEMRISLGLEEWQVALNSSASAVENQSVSFVRPASVARGDYAGETVLGVRVHFPLAPFNAWALVKPPFEIPAYYGQGGAQFDGRGVLKNVGVIKEIQVNAYGLNFPHGLSVVLKDHENREREYFIGNLEFDGWRTLTWRNPAYINDVRNRELRIYPLYPRLAPSLRFVGLRIYRDSIKEGGDFVTYFRDVTIVYDKAILELAGDIDDEDIWNILTSRSEQRNAAQIRNLGELQVLRFLEEQKLHKDTETAQ